MNAHILCIHRLTLPICDGGLKRAGPCEFFHPHAKPQGPRWQLSFVITAVWFTNSKMNHIVQTNWSSASVDRSNHMTESTFPCEYYYSCCLENLHRNIRIFFFQCATRKSDCFKRLEHIYFHFNIMLGKGIFIQMEMSNVTQSLPPFRGRKMWTYRMWIVSE